MPASCRATVALLLALVASGVTAGEEEATAPGGSQDASPPAGLKAYLDPATGRLVSEPPFGRPALTITEEGVQMFDTSHVGLVPRVRPDGGLMINLRGRFRQGTVATVTEGGEIECQRIGGEMFLTPTGRTIRDRLDERRAPEPASGAGR